MSPRLHSRMLRRVMRARRLRRARIAAMGVIVVALGLSLALPRREGAGAHGSPGGRGVMPPRADYPVRGIDVSAHNGVIDFNAVAADSIDFVLIKATEGAGFKDRMFVDNYRRASRTGLPLGAYHFFRFDVAGHLQAYNLLHSVEGRKFALPLVIDVEDWGNPRNYPPEQVAERLAEMVEVLESHGRNVAIYSNKDGFAKYLRDTGLWPSGSRDLWICSFTSPPLGAEGRWAYWQHTHSGRVDGIEGDVDMSCFNGSREQWLLSLDALRQPGL